MNRCHDSALLADMPAAAVSTLERPAGRGYHQARSAATRPILSLSAFRAGRHSRAIQLSWVGLVQR